MAAATSITFLDLPQIEQRLKGLDLVGLMEDAFAAFSRGEAVVPAPGELLLEDPPGEVHIKYGYLTGGDTYVIKIASGFWNNPAIGLSSSDGLLLVFRKATGELMAVLNDRGRLTDLRTAAAGAVCCKASRTRRYRCDWSARNRHPGGAAGANAAIGPALPQCRGLGPQPGARFGLCEADAQPGFQRRHRALVSGGGRAMPIDRHGDCERRSAAPLARHPARNAYHGHRRRQCRQAGIGRGHHPQRRHRGDGQPEPGALARRNSAMPMATIHRPRTGSSKSVRSCQERSGDAVLRIRSPSRLFQVSRFRTSQWPRRS